MRPETGRYLLPDLHADTGSGHNITATVYLEWLSMYRVQGPAELRSIARNRKRQIGVIDFAGKGVMMPAGGKRFRM
jgi:L-fuconolactonase